MNRRHGKHICWWQDMTQVKAKAYIPVANSTFVFVFRLNLTIRQTVLPVNWSLCLLQAFLHLKKKTCDFTSLLTIPKTSTKGKSSSDPSYKLFYSWSLSLQLVFHPVGVISLVRLVASRQSDPTISRKAMDQPIYLLNLQLLSYARRPMLILCKFGL